MKYNKFFAIAALSFITLGLSACSSPENSFKNNLNLGSFHNMSISWLEDDTTSKGNGFYIIDDSTYDKNVVNNNNNFDPEELIGHYNDLDIYFVNDHSSSSSKGFYFFKNKEGDIVPSLTEASRFKSGKTHSTKDIGILFKSAISKQESININLDNNTINVNQLTPNEMIALSI